MSRGRHSRLTGGVVQTHIRGLHRRTRERMPSELFRAYLKPYTNKLPPAANAMYCFPLTAYVIGPLVRALSRAQPRPRGLRCAACEALALFKLNSRFVERRMHAFPRIHVKQARVRAERWRKPIGAAALAGVNVRALRRRCGTI